MREADTTPTGADARDVVCDIVPEPYIVLVESAPEPAVRTVRPRGPSFFSLMTANRFEKLMRRTRPQMPYQSVSCAEEDTSEMHEVV